ncbi:MAG: hypothetical protein ABL934_09770 [Lysobacteraceae bacterium]
MNITLHLSYQTASDLAALLDDEPCACTDESETYEAHVCRVCRLRLALGLPLAAGLVAAEHVIAAEAG